MKVVVFPGVGADGIRSSYEYFLDKITKGLNCDGEIFVWENGHDHPKINLPLKDVRSFVCEVILDFQQVVVHAMEMKVPEADIYIGHSAGSILALAQNKPCVTFGSPAALVELINTNNGGTTKSFSDIIKANSNNVLNIINKYDVIAYPIKWDNVENYEYTPSWYRPLSYFPVMAHIHYWKSQKAIEKIIKTVKEWK
jgi:hypothetical protein